MEIYNFNDLYSQAKSLTETSNIENTDLSNVYELNDVYFISFSITVKPSNTLKKGFIAKKFNGEFQILEILIPNKFINDIIPIHEFYNEKGIHGLVSPGNRGVVDIKKYKITLTLQASKKINEKPKIILTSVEEIKEEPADISNKVIEILKEKPYLVGFLGIRKINIPLVIENSIAEKLLEKKCSLISEPLGLDAESTLSRKITAVMVEKENFPKIIIPSTLGKKKAYYIYNTPPRNILNVINQDLIILDGYTFYTNTKMIIGVIKEPSKYFENSGTSNIATFVTESLLEKEEENIKALIKADPITEKQFMDITGFSMDYLTKVLVVYGEFIKNRLSIDNSLYLKLIAESKENLEDDRIRNSIIFAITIAEDYIKNNNRIKIEEENKNTESNNAEEKNDDKEKDKVENKKELKMNNYNDLLKLLEIIEKDKSYDGIEREKLEKSLSSNFGLFKSDIDIIRNYLIKNNIITFDIETTKIKPTIRLFEGLKEG